MRAVVAFTVLASCGRLDFGPDQPVIAPDHLAAVYAPDWNDVLVLDGATIDTDVLTIDGSAAIDHVTVATQTGGGEVAVVIAGQLQIVGSETVVVGSRPVIFAAGTIEVTAVLDAGGHGATDGPGAGATTAQTGSDDADGCDTGGGGGGHATAGGASGTATACSGATLIGAAGGVAVDDATLASLVGGERGADAGTADCGLFAAGGGGGGALQLTAAASLQIGGDGVVRAGGGGGAGGPDCSNQFDAGGGGGGGAAGAIYLQAARIDLDGVVLAHGGGGGGAGDAGSGVAGAGQPGADGVTLAPAAGGAPYAVPATNGSGGSGGTGDIAPASSPAVARNSGGGGGAAGRIVVHGELAGVGTASPSALVVAP